MQNFISPEFVKDDLEYLIRNADVKVNKRINRLKVLYQSMGLDPNKVDDLPQLVDKGNKVFNQQEIDDFINTVPDEFTRVVQLQGKLKDNDLKKTIEGLLTSQLNSNMMVYEVSYNLVVRLLKRIESDKHFGPLYHQNDFIPVFKGGLASRLVLLSKFPDFENEIKQAFGFGGDNDCSFMINPDLPNFDELQNRLIKICHKFLLDVSGPASYGLVNKQAINVNSINLNGIIIPVQSFEKHSFSIVDGGVMTSDYAHRKPVYVSRNDTLDFQIAGGRGKFALVRLKQAFKVGSRVLSAEILDIAIPHKHDDNFRNHFNCFKDGTYLIKAKFTNGELI